METDHEWVRSSNGYVPLSAVIGGHDWDGAKIYVGRSFHEGEHLPAKVIPSLGRAYVSSGGYEIPKNDFDVLTGEHYFWIPCTPGVVPSNAVLTGNTITGEGLYIGRGHWGGSLTVGKIQGSDEFLHIPFKLEEHRLNSYEILTYERRHGRMDGQSHNVQSQQFSQAHSSSYRLTTGTAHHEAHVWVNLSNRAEIPPLAVIGGYDWDDAPIYVGRSSHECATMPAKVIPVKDAVYLCAFVSWGGLEISKSDFQVLTGHDYFWIPCAGGVIPPNAVLAGNTVTGDLLYIGRGEFRGSLTVGRIHHSHHCLYIPFGTKEHCLYTYDILVYEKRREHSVETEVPNNDRRQGWMVGKPHYVPPQIVLAGNDSNNLPIYVGRALHEGVAIPAKIIPNKGLQCVCFDGLEIHKDEFEVLTGEGYSWVEATHGANLPPNAVSTGNTRNGEPVFVGRGHHGGSLTPGRVDPSDHCLYIPYGGKEIKLTTYEVLVKN